MHDLKWTESEKKLARVVFNSCLTAELDELISTFKSKAAAAATRARERGSDMRISGKMRAARIPVDHARQQCGAAAETTRCSRQQDSDR